MLEESEGLARRLVVPIDSLQALLTRLAHETLCQPPMAIPPESEVVELDLAAILEARE
jgi:hypothetical protein